jgi:N5-(cytidine 5'-diphosphoramidyl)-L-glutamine hydrolase
MKIGLSMEMTRKLRDTWHAAINSEWYDFLSEHDIVPLSCHAKIPQTDEFDLIILAGGNDMHGIKTWRDNHYPIRDHYEHSLIQQCLLTKTPVVGICRGAHFMNYVMGGTHKLMYHPYDNVIVSLPKFNVTCHHTIQIDMLASGFEILQQDKNGIVELVVNKSSRMLGIGWHPEREVNKHTRQYILDLIKDL